MRASLACAAIWLAAWLTADAALGLVVFVRSPREGAPVFGQVTVEVEVLSDQPVTEVEIRLDGETVALLTEEPYRTVVDVAEENRGHTFEIVATNAAGEQARRTLVTGMIPIDDQIELELQQLYVTATRDGQRVLDLTADQFAIVDDREPQRRVTFERGDVPLTAVLLIDSSLSMEGRALASALAGARAFMEGMGPLDEAKVMVFSDRLLAATPFTGDPARVQSAVEAVTPSGSTTINDHLYLALQALDARQGRKVIVLLSDGLDIDSVLRMADVEWKAGRVQSVIYWIRPAGGADLEKEQSSIWRDAEAQRQEIEGIRRAVSASGGRQVPIDRIQEAAGAFREILQELRDQYVLGYYPSRNLGDGAWHEVEVRISEPGVKVRVRGGYYDDR